MHGRWPITNTDQVLEYIELTAAKCPGCRYNLRGLRDPICPECGEVLTVDKLAGPRGWRAWVERRRRAKPPSAPWALIVANVLVAGLAIVLSLAYDRHIPIAPLVGSFVLGSAVFSATYCDVFRRSLTGYWEQVDEACRLSLAVVLATQGVCIGLTFVA